MAFKVKVINMEHCDKCGSKDGDLLEIATTGRYSDERNLIFVHERCLERSIQNAKKRAHEIEKTGETQAKVG